jgi:hypothetical protein
MVPADMDGDGREDLVLAVAYSTWDRLSVTRIEDLVEVTTIVPVLYDRREARVYLAGPDGYRLAGPPLDLPSSVIALEAGPPGLPVLALTEAGVSVLRLGSGPAAGAPSLEPLVEEPSVLAGAGAFLPDLDFVTDLDGDGSEDVLLPARDGLVVRRISGGRLEADRAGPILLPGDRRGGGASAWRTYPIPRVEDLNGDRLPDLLVKDDRRGSIHALPGTGGGSFGEPVEIALRCLRGPATPGRPGGRLKAGPAEVAFVGDLDGDRLAEVVLKREIDSGEKDLEQAKEPHHVYGLYRMRPDLSVEGRPYAEFEAVGHALSGDLAGFSIPEFQDLDGDGRKDLVTVTLDFSILQAVRVLATKRIGVGLRFHVRAQDAGGAFVEVPDLDLEETLRLDLNDMKLGRFARFAGDFDGDGAKDFVRFGRGRTLAVHRGRPGCRYPSKPDLVIELEAEPPEMELIRVADLDGDGRSDVAVTRPRPAPGPGEIPSVSLELLVSGAAP